MAKVALHLLSAPPSIDVLQWLPDGSYRDHHRLAVHTQILRPLYTSACPKVFFRY